MLHIFFNEKSDTNNYIDLNINKHCISAFCRLYDNDGQSEILSGKDIIETVRSYSTYILVDANAGKVKNYRKINKSDYRFLDINRLGVSVRMEFFSLYSLFASHDILQIDTGMISEDSTERDIIIRIFEGNKNSFHITSDLEYDIGIFNSDDLPTAVHPRHYLWDQIGLKIVGNDTIYKSNDRGGIEADDDTERPIIINADTNDDKKYIEFEVVKFNGTFDKELTRVIDNEEIFIETTSGLVNTRRVKLVNGRGTFRLYPLGYTGEFKIKLGRKWYEVWNEYSMKLENSL